MQIEAAKEMGVSYATFHNWETGERAPQKHLRERITGFLGYDPGEHGVVFPERVVLRRRKEHSI
jgi:transcriptional regulator with XRE-family HTH domain